MVKTSRHERTGALRRQRSSHWSRNAQAELANGASIAALRRFNAALSALDAGTWQDKLTPVLAEHCYNLESFNPAFAATVLAVQKSIGHSDYLRRDAALKRLIVPLAGEYGMHNGEPQSALPALLA